MCLDKPAMQEVKMESIQKLMKNTSKELNSCGFLKLQEVLMTILDGLLINWLIVPCQYEAERGNVMQKGKLSFMKKAFKIPD